MVWAENILGCGVIYNKNLKVLDLGCGLSRVFTTYKNYTGVDFSDHVINARKKTYFKYKWVHAGLTKIYDIIKDEEFDIVFSFDVLEHIPTDKIDIVFNEISRLNVKQFLFSICTRDSVIRGPEGGTLHPTVKPIDWWLDKLKRNFEVIASSELNKHRTFYVLCRSNV
jgi:SAM-dependent methyltransferase